MNLDSIMTDVRALKTVKTEACLLFCQLFRNRKFQGGEESSQSEALVRNSDPPEPSKTDRNKPRKLGNKINELSLHTSKNASPTSILQNVRPTPILHAQPPPSPYP